MKVTIPKKVKTDVGIATYHAYTKRYSANHEGRRQHLAKKVYEFCYGKIPDGFEIHHVDGNRLNDHVSNLIAISHEDHVKLHRGHKGVAYEVEVIENKVREEDPIVVLTFGGKK